MSNREVDRNTTVATGKIVPPLCYDIMYDDKNGTDTRWGSAFSDEQLAYSVRLCLTANPSTTVRVTVFSISEKEDHATG